VNRLLLRHPDPESTRGRDDSDDIMTARITP